MSLSLQEEVEQNMITSLYLIMIAHCICKTPPAPSNNQLLAPAPGNINNNLEFHNNNNNNAAIGWGDLVAGGGGGGGAVLDNLVARGAAVPAGSGDDASTTDDASELSSQREMRLHTAVYR